MLHMHILIHFMCCKYSYSMDSIELHLFSLHSLQHLFYRQLKMSWVPSSACFNCFTPLSEATQQGDVFSGAFRTTYQLVRLCRTWIAISFSPLYVLSAVIMTELFSAPTCSVPFLTFVPSLKISPCAVSVFVFFPSSLFVFVSSLLLYSEERCSPIHLNVILERRVVVFVFFIWEHFSSKISSYCASNFKALLLPFLIRITFPYRKDNQTQGEGLGFLPYYKDISSSTTITNGTVPVFSPLLSSPGVCCSLLACSHRQAALLLWTPLSVEHPLFP